MKKIFKNVALLTIASTMSTISMAQSQEEAEKSLPLVEKNVKTQSKTLDESFIAEMKENLRPHFPETVEIKGIEYSGVSDIYFFNVGGQALMFAEEGEYIINGGMFDMGDEAVNMLDEYLAKYHVEILKTFEEKDKIVYQPEGEVLGSVTVFTDPSCPFCTKFHNNMDQYLDYGIQVSYLPFPRGGAQGPGYNDILKTWCADGNEKRKKLITAAKNGNKPPVLVNQKVNKECEEDLTRVLNMQSELGITGTPAVFLNKSGKQVGGYVEPAKLFMEVKDQ